MATVYPEARNLCAVVSSPTHNHLYAFEKLLPGAGGRWRGYGSS